MGTHNKSENGRGAWVAVCAQRTHTDTEHICVIVDTVFSANIW
jgi:hypothetical protein